MEAHLTNFEKSIREVLQFALDDADSEILGAIWEQQARAALAKVKGE